MSDNTAPAQPSGGGKVLLGGIFFVAALVLVWVGWALPADSASAMEGGQRLLFTVVPIRPFAWIMAVVFVWLGWRVVKSVPPPEGPAA